MARMVALVYNWWNIFVRLAGPDKHLEAITTRPLLLAVSPNGRGIAARPRYGSLRRMAAPAGQHPAKLRGAEVNCRF